MQDKDKTHEELLSELERLRTKVNQLEKTTLEQTQREKRALLIINEMYQFAGLLDSEGRMIESNQASLDVVGLNRNEVIGKPFWETIWWNQLPESQEKVKKAISEAIKGEFVRFEAQYFAGDKSKNTFVDFSLKPIFNEQGKVIYLLPEGRDITEKKLIEAEIADKNKELAQKHEELLLSYKQANKIFSALSDLLPGMVLDDKYLLEDKIGVGGYGAVYQAKHLHLNRNVAIKIFRPSPGNDSIESFERFRLEGISTSHVNHPNAVAILDSGISKDSIAYLVMELLEGHSLSSLLRRETILPIKYSLEILIPICNVLAQAHTLGIIHRDIKPENIFLHQTEEGEIVKVVDFGIAKLMDDKLEQVQNLTGTGGIIGTPIYMAPERLSKKPYDGKSDIYSLAIMAYQMLAGCMPFNFDSCSFLDIFLIHLKETPPSLKELNPNVPDHINTLIMNALAKDPTIRPTAQELSQAFTQVINVGSQTPIYNDPSMFSSNKTTLENAQGTLSNTNDANSLSTTSSRNKDTKEDINLKD